MAAAKKNELYDGVLEYNKLLTRLIHCFEDGMIGHAKERWVADKCRLARIAIGADVMMGFASVTPRLIQYGDMIMSDDGWLLLVDAGFNEEQKEATAASAGQDFNEIMVLTKLCWHNAKPDEKIAIRGLVRDLLSLGATCMLMRDELAA
jgi:hypothetical protein